MYHSEDYASAVHRQERDRSLVVVTICGSQIPAGRLFEGLAKVGRISTSCNNRMDAASELHYYDGYNGLHTPARTHRNVDLRHTVKSASGEDSARSDNDWQLCLW